MYNGVKPLRIDHFNVFSTNVDESVEFYSDLGFRVTEYTEDEKTKKLCNDWVKDYIESYGYVLGYYIANVKMLDN